MGPVLANVGPVLLANLAPDTANVGPVFQSPNEFYKCADRSVSVPASKKAVLTREDRLRADKRYSSRSAARVFSRWVKSFSFGLRSQTSRRNSHKSIVSTEGRSEIVQLASTFCRPATGGNVPVGNRERLGCND